MITYDPKQLRCHCCGKYVASPELLVALDKIQDLWPGKKITINCGTRCKRHNAAVGGERNSQHLVGTAIDFSVAGILPSQVYRTLDKQSWAHGLGKYRTFTHLDVRTSNFPARWDYSKGK